MSRQLIFDWPVGVALRAADFFVAGPNTQAYAMVSDPGLWPQGKLALVGPKGAGKSHLARVFARAENALTLPANKVATVGLPERAVVIEGADALPATGQEPLFHLHNHLRSAGLPLLLTARTPPARWPFTLPDLASRMQATTVVTIEPPDDALLSAVVMKHFADRQLMPAPEVIAFLTRRIERSYDAAATVVARVDQAAMSQARPITVPFCRALLDKTGQ